VSVAQENDLLQTNQNRQLWPELAAAAAVLLGLEMLLLALWRRPVAQLRGSRSEEFSERAARTNGQRSSSIAPQRETEVLR
jgi:hypothetical protein